MVTFRNNNTNNRRSNFRRNDRNFKSNGDRQKFGTNFSNNENFKRKVPGRNNHNASKLIEKYNDLAREASSNGDKILSENYLQHADHFTRILNERESFRKDKFAENKSENKLNNLENTVSTEIISEDLTEVSTDENEDERNKKNQVEANWLIPNIFSGLRTSSLIFSSKGFLSLPFKTFLMGALIFVNYFFSVLITS